MSSYALFIFSALLQGALSMTVNVNPKELIVKSGDPVQMMCQVSAPLEFCRFEMPGEGSFSVSPLKRGTHVSYRGDGLEKGQCGFNLEHATEKHNGEVRCGLTSVETSKESLGVMKLIVARIPNPPELIVFRQPSGADSYKEGDVIEASCLVRNGRPAATIYWYIGDEKLTEGMSPPREEHFEKDDLYNVVQNLTRRIQASDNGKPLRCVAGHPLPFDRNTTQRQITVKYPPKPSEPFERFGLVEGEEGRIGVTVMANPRPAFLWNIGGERINEGDADASGRIKVLPGAETKTPGNWESTLIINPLIKEDVEREYILEASNPLGEQKYKILISTNPEPKMLELGAGAIVGIVVAVLFLLTIAAVLLFARAKGRWCFAGTRSPQYAGESSDTESAEHSAHHPKIRKTPFTSVFKKKNDKVSGEEAPSKNDPPEGNKPAEESTDEAGRVMLNPRSPDEAVVYAELDLNTAPRPTPVVRPEDDKTEYAEIIHTKDK